MFRSMVFRKSVAGVLAVCVLAMVACEQHEAVDVAAPEPEPVADVVDQFGTTEGYAYFPGNPFHEARFDGLIHRPDVAVVVNGLAARGLRVAPDKSMTIRGANEDGAVWVTFIALDGGERSAMIACYGTDDRVGIAPIEFALSRPPNETGWKPFVGNGWYTIPPVGPTRRSPQRWEPTDWWDWDFFGDCLARRAPEASAVCGFSCMMVPGFWQCFLVCTVAEAVGATIACILAMYTWGGNEITKE
jgi:hypothetical protein